MCAGFKRGGRILCFVSASFSTRRACRTAARHTAPLRQRDRLIGEESRLGGADAIGAIDARSALEVVGRSVERL
jgi:hypothetical protein